MKRLASSILVLIAVLGLSIAVGCSKKDEEKGPAEKAGETVDDAAKEAGDAGKKAADDMEDAADEMTDAVKDAGG
jgi:hypothetical protein